MKKTVFWTIVIAQTVLVTLLAVQIVKKNNILGAANYAVVSKNDIKSYPSGNLRFFYEKLPNDQGTDVAIGFEDIKSDYRTNSDGLRGTKEYLEIKPVDTYRLVALGDSFTFGLGVNDDESYPYKLEQKMQGSHCSNLKDFEVLNLGTPGYDIVYALEKFKIRGQKYNPDLVVWLLKEDDLIEYEEAVRTAVDKEERNEALLSKLPRGLVSPKKSMEIYYKALDETMKTYGEEELIKIQTGALSDFNKHYQGELLIVSLSFDDKYNQILKEFAGERNHSHYLHLTLDNDFRFADGHPNGKGYEFISQAIFDYLMREKIILCD